jgi:hypothetical protein
MHVRPACLRDNDCQVPADNNHPFETALTLQRPPDPGQRSLLVQSAKGLSKTGVTSFTYLREDLGVQVNTISIAWRLR